MTEPAIVCQDLSKQYVQYEDESLLLKRLLQPHKRRERRDIWALRDISFTAQPGETVGVVGRNGSGKTTLLRLLSGVSAPSSGRMIVRGRTAPLIGVGVGFHPELTGRENVRVNGRLLGMTSDEVSAKFDRIVEFSEIEEFIDTPVKYYSSGMFLRLAFSVAIHTEPEVLLVDEILAVGDMAFQLKCNERMREIQERGTTIVIVTHNLAMLNRMAPRAIVLDRGGMVFDGPVEEALGAYHEVMQVEAEGRDARTAALLNEGRDLQMVGGASVRARLVGEDGSPRQQFGAGEPITVRVTAEFEEEHTDPMLGVLVGAAGRGGIFHTNMRPGQYSGTHGPERPLEAEVTLDNSLLDGSYTVRVGVVQGEGRAMLGSTPDLPFYVHDRRTRGGIVDLRPRIRIGDTQVEFEQVDRLGGDDDVTGRGSGA